METDPARPDGPIVVTIVLSNDRSIITARHGGRSVVYRAGGELDDLELCA